MGERRGTKALELWCRRMTEGYPGVKIDNMTTSWRDGLAFCAMIHHFRPELIEFEKLNKDDVYYNNDLAFRTAERHLGIPALLDADDMASYEVPDRLSILTYLSQFYQVFASQDSNRLNNKRTSTVAEKSSIPKQTGPPPKMAHVVGVPKRDPCQKCSLPVFLAERLTIGKRVYHRTCLKCARCNSQLTPGSFYETEIDGEYCCETCPDEEKTLDKSSFSKERESDIGSSSIADRLAFFENDGKKVLQKSLSDEEKSQSLKKISEAHSSTVYKPNTSLSNFMNNHLVDDLDSPSHSNSRRSSRTSIYSSDSSAIEDISEGPPELPKSLPPPLEEDIANSKSLNNTSPDTSLVDTTSIIKQTPPDVNNKNETQNENIQDETQISQNEPSALDSTEQHEQIEENPPCPSTPTNTTVTTENDLNLSVNVTKDSPENDGQMRTREDQTPTDKIITNIDPSLTDDSPSTNRSSMVRARLHQFEVIANKPQDSSISSVSKTKLSDFNKTRKSSIDETLKSLETEVPKFDSKQEDSIMLQPSTDKLTNKIEDNDENASYHKSIEENNDVNEEKAIQETDNSNDTIEEDKQTELQENIEDSTELLKNKEDSTELPGIKEDSTELPESKDSTELPESKEHSVPSAPSAPVISPRRKLSDNAAIIPDVVDSYKPPVTQVEVPDNKNDGAVVIPTEEYPEDLNPFKSDDDEECDLAATSTKEKRKSLNPFDSSDDEEQMPGMKVKPPRPPPPKKISTNPFGSESEEEDQLNSIESKSSSTPKRVPVPTPRNYKSTSQNPTPEPTPRVTRQRYGTPLKNSEEYYGSSISLSASGLRDVSDFSRDSEVRGSNRSLASSSGSTSTRYRKTKKAPAPPPPTPKTAKELFPTHDSDSKKSSPNSSKATTPTPRKKRPAPPPPSVSKSEVSLTSPVKSPIPALPEDPLIERPNDELNNSEQSPATIEKLSDEEKALLEKKVPENIQSESQSSLTSEGSTKRRIVALDACLIEDANSSQDLQIKEEANTVYRRVIASLDINDPAISFKYHDGESHDRQLEKLKDNKEAKNRNRQSQISLSPEENDPLFNKSIHGKWKRRKGPAPALPVPPKKVLQMLPLQEIRHELEIIEVQQQGLEKQGVMLEKMIRERCEGPVGMESIIENPGSVPNSKEVEDLILQLFELVNEKNELFRRQAELMYLRRQHRLEQEQADLEYEIRVLMAQPERNKTDSDKAREEALIARLVEVVQLRNEVVECLEMDRLREAEEDLSIKQRLEMHSAKRDEELNKQTPTKLSKKEKKKQKELKKLGKSKKLDADKDADESEISAEKQKLKKKKKISILKAINF